MKVLAVTAVNSEETQELATISFRHLHNGGGALLPAPPTIHLNVAPPNGYNIRFRLSEAPRVYAFAVALAYTLMRPQNQNTTW